MGKTRAQIHARTLWLAEFSAHPDATQEDNSVQLYYEQVREIYARVDPMRWATTAQIALVAGTESYALSDFFRTLLGVFLIPETGYRYEIFPYQAGTHDGLKTSPLSAGTVQYWFASKASLMTTDSDVTDLPSEGDELISVLAAIELREREESDISTLERRRDALISLIERGQFDKGVQDGIEDVYNRRGSRMGPMNDRRLFYKLLGNQIRFVEAEF